MRGKGIELRIDEELRDLIPRMHKDEYELLKQSINERGVVVPIHAWNTAVMTGGPEEFLIVDGHTRCEISRDIGEGDPPFVTGSFRSREEAMVWIIDNQRARRNLSREQLLELGFKRAELLKPKADENRIEGNRAGGKSFQKSEMTKPDEERVNTTAVAADYAGVSVDTATRGGFPGFSLHGSIPTRGSK